MASIIPVCLLIVYKYPFYTKRRQHPPAGGKGTTLAPERQDEGKAALLSERLEKIGRGKIVTFKASKG